MTFIVSWIWGFSRCFQGTAVIVRFKVALDVAWRQSFGTHGTHLLVLLKTIFRFQTCSNQLRLSSNSQIISNPDLCANYISSAVAGYLILSYQRLPLLWSWQAKILGAWLSIWHHDGATKTPVGRKSCPAEALQSWCDAKGNPLQQRSLRKFWTWRLRDWY